MNSRILSSLDELRGAAAQWDDLWLRSDLASPLLRAERIVAWCGRFAVGSTFRAVVLEAGGRFVAGLPVVGSLPGLRAYPAILPNNHWSATAELLFDAEHDPAALARALARSLRRLPWPLVVCRLCRLDRPAWKALGSVGPSEGLRVHPLASDAIGSLCIEPSPDGHGLRGTRNHRRTVSKALRRMDEHGGRRLRVHAAASPAEVERWMRAGFAIEDSGWKREFGSSVLRSEGMSDYFIAEAQSLAVRGELLLYFLEFEGRDIAFQYAFRAKDHVFLSKTGYEDAHAKLSPGHVLTLDLLDHLARDGAASGGARGPLVVEFGPMNDATAHWVDRSHPVGTILLAHDSPLGHAGLTGARAWLAWRARRRRKQGTLVASAPST